MNSWAYALLLEPSWFERSSLKEATFPQNTKYKEKAEKEPECDQAYQPPRDNVVVLDLEHVLFKVKLRILNHPSVITWSMRKILLLSVSPLRIDESELMLAVHTTSNNWEPSG